MIFLKINEINESVARLIFLKNRKNTGKKNTGRGDTTIDPTESNRIARLA